MDWIEMRGKMTDLAKRYRYALLVLAVGLCLMLIPFSAGHEETVQPSIIEPTQECDLATQLEEILSKVRGAGEVEVLLTVAKGEKTVYQSDEDRGSDGSLRVDTVIISDGNRNQSGLVQQIESPVYQGAVVVCQGADQPSVRLAIVEAVCNATGLGADKISVLSRK